MPFAHWATGDRNYVEVYICEELANQSYEFEGQKIPFRIW